MRLPRPRGFLFAVLAGVLFFSFGSVPALSAPADKKLVLLLIDGLNFDDICRGSLSSLDEFTHQAAWGLMNTAVAGQPNLESAYLTLGAGTRARSPGNLPGFTAFEVMPDEPGTAAEVYGRRSGHKVTQGVVQPGIGILELANANLGYQVRLGALGQVLREAGIKTAAIGTADTNTLERPVVNALMDETGYVPYGYTAPDLFHPDPDGPFGAWTDPEAVLQRIGEVWDKAQVFVVEWADLYRVEAYIPFLRPGQNAALREQALARLDVFLRSFLARFGDRATILLIGPAPGNRDFEAGRRLTPVALWDHRTKPGLLTSATTRRAGLIANIDIAPSVLAFFNLPQPAAMLGRPITGLVNGSPLAELAALERRAVLNFNQRPFVIRVYIAYLIAVLALAVVAFWRPLCVSRWLNFLLPAGATVPLTFLVLAALPPQPLPATLGMSVLFTALFVAGFGRLTGSGSGALMLSGFSTVLLLTWDVLHGQRLVASSLLGYCYISGARYYGLGNEYMGVFLGAGLTLAAYLLDRHRLPTWSASLFLFFLLSVGSFLMGANGLGSNAGGTLAWASGLGTALLGIKRSEIRLGDVTSALFLAGVFLALLAWSDWQLAAKASHIGRALNLASNSGTQVLLDTIVRKAEMNLRLIRYSLWSRVLLMLLLALTSLFLGPCRLRPQFMRERQFLTACLRGSLIGTLVALVANDSGVVAAATGLLFPVLFLILLALSTTTREKQQNQQELAMTRN
ncbi:MAG: hypothetical protein PWQ41_471 [Bacillota bacterium]|jgi:hypothetical protein|nr:hypothetical protein [Bacillota bacterium]MDK2855723.1 hypothetical protein [Bacillota bacterium]MDK2924697.1 hypothetical protein [Bacillota bacterium]